MSANHEHEIDTVPIPEQAPGHNEAKHFLESSILNPGWNTMLAADARDLGMTADPTWRGAALAMMLGDRAWDTRGRGGVSKERQDVGAQAIDDSPGSPIWDLTFAGARELGLVESSKPQNNHPDYLVVLGGANLSPFNRLQYGLEAVEDFGTLVYLGSARPLSEKEREATKVKAPGALDEFDLGCAAFAALPDAKVVDEYQQEDYKSGEVWRTRVYQFTQNGQTKTAFALSTPRSVNGRRATTYDNWRYFAQQAELQPGDKTSIVGVTTAHYTLGQKAPAVLEVTLPFGAHVEMIGHSAEYAGSRRKASELRQEAIAGWDALVRLMHAL